MIRAGRRPNAWLLRDGLGGALGSPSSPTRFRLQIPTGSSPSTAVRPKTGIEWSSASSSELTVSGEWWPVECRRRGLPSWTRSGASYLVTLPTGPTFGGGNWSNSVVADRKGNRPGNDVVAKCMDQWHLALHSSMQGQRRRLRGFGESGAKNILLHSPAEWQVRKSLQSQSRNALAGVGRAIGAARFTGRHSSLLMYGLSVVEVRHDATD
jgi:hypothetical protein